MRAVHTVRELRDNLTPIRIAGRVIGLVPTMGALHTGHARLMERARKESDLTVVSIFVNPLQFGPNEDFARYPRAFEADLELCRQNGMDFVFAPSVEEMYPLLPQLTFADVARVSDHLCGASRPGHFRGVATVVLKLFNVVQPERAYFGEKDAQQLAVIRRMTLDLNIPITIVGVETVRETDGLAISSRNRYLDADQRRIAPSLYRALQEAASTVREGETEASRVRTAALQILAENKAIRLDYLEVVDPDEMQPVSTIAGPVRIAGAIWLGSTRLIDNILVSKKPTTDGTDYTDDTDGAHQKH